MQKLYSLIICLFFTVFSSFAQYGAIFDSEHFNNVLENGAARLLSERQFQSVQQKMTQTLGKINQNFTKVLAVTVLVENSLCNVNSGLRNIKSVKLMPGQLKEISSNTEKLAQICLKKPQYTFLVKRYIEYAVTQSIALQQEVTDFALSGSHNIVMNYNQRDQVIRDIQIRLDLINSNLVVAQMVLKQAIQLGFLRGATPFGDWLNRDEMLVREVIQKSKYL